MLGKLIQETVPNAEGKIEKVLAKTEEQMTIIPDKNTFSLIVHANRKNQDWIAGLVERLDKRRPQVLIDVTLVEITETESFNYDLNLIASAPDLTQTSGLTGHLVPAGQPRHLRRTSRTSSTASGRSQFADFQSNSGDLTAFYGDKHINLLLQAMQSKNYGRVLAKPKILVNDNEPGTDQDRRYDLRREAVPRSPSAPGGAGNRRTLIQTAVDYQSYEAGITLNITPHISQGDLLRLEIELTRSDFRDDRGYGEAAGQDLQRAQDHGLCPGRQHDHPRRPAPTQPEQRRGQGADPGRYPPDRRSIPQHQQPRHAEQAVHLRQDRDHPAGRHLGRGSMSN